MADDALTVEVRARGAGTSAADLEAYARAGAALGGAALCTSIGAAPLGPACASIAAAFVGTFIAWAASMAAHGSDLEDLATDSLNWIGQRIPAARAKWLAVKAYSVARADVLEALTSELYARIGRNRDILRQNVSAQLTSYGAPPARAIPQWWPDAGRFAAFGAKLAAWTSGAIPAEAIVGSQLTGLDPVSYLTLIYAWNGPPADPAGSEADLGRISEDAQAVERARGLVVALPRAAAAVRAANAPANLLGGGLAGLRRASKRAAPAWPALPW